MRVMIALLIAFALHAQPRYDFLLKGGRVIDPRNNVNAVRDVAISGNRIAAVAANIPPAESRAVIDVSSLYVTPGLVDLHVHVFAGTMGREYTGTNGVRPDGFTFRSGVTTAVDAGSSGWRNFAEFKEQIIDRSPTRVLAMLNIVGRGMGGRDDVEQDAADMDPKPLAELAGRHRGLIVGVKTAHYLGPEWIAVERAVEAGELAKLPVMVDFGSFRPERPFPDLVLKKLRRGDIYTHAYRDQVPMLDQGGKLLPYLAEARKRGVLFDVGHGGGSFVFRQAAPAVQLGFWPDSISSDLHTGSMNAGMKDLLNVVSKFLNMGMPIEEAIARCTWNPARQIRREDLGHLTAGAPADIAVLRLEKGDFGFVDAAGFRMRGTGRLISELTIRDGAVVWDLNGITRPVWNAPPSPR